jgi:hypothetical protein
MPAREIRPEIEIEALLPGAQFADAFRLELLPGPVDMPLDAPAAARRMVGNMPGWARTLLAIRERAVAPFGLKHPTAGAAGQIGIFPILTQAADRIVLGINDRHLDFRLVVEVAEIGGRRRVTATTIVKTHNLLGRTYLATIMPFHRLMARTLLDGAALP